MIEFLFWIQMKCQKFMNLTFRRFLWDLIWMKTKKKRLAKNFWLSEFFLFKNSSCQIRLYHFWIYMCQDIFDKSSVVWCKRVESWKKFLRFFFYVVLKSIWFYFIKNKFNIYSRAHCFIFHIFFISLFFFISTHCTLKKKLQLETKINKIISYQIWDFIYFF